MTRPAVTGNRLRIVLHDDPQALRDAQLSVSAFLRQRGAGPRGTGWAELLVEELALNTLRHGFPAGEAAELTVTVWQEGARCGLDFEDRGLPFDPTAPVALARPRSLRRATPGGLGLPLLQRIAAGLRYERTADGRNRLRVVLPAEDAAIG